MLVVAAAQQLVLAHLVRVPRQAVPAQSGTETLADKARTGMHIWQKHLQGSNEPLVMTLPEARRMMQRHTGEESQLARANTSKGTLQAGSKHMEWQHTLLLHGQSA